jgi:sugar lactone lactonase YvrE
VATIAGTGTAGYLDGPGASAQLNGPMAVAVSADGEVYFADELNQRIRKVQCEGTECTVSTVAGSGSAGYVDGPAATAQFNHPVDLWVRDDRLLVVDYSNHRIRAISLGDEGTVSTLAGSGQVGSTNGPALDASFNGPDGLAVDAAGVIYVADSIGQMVRAIQCVAAVCTVSTLAGSGEVGWLDGPAESARFQVPVDVAADVQGRVVVAEWINMALRLVDGGVVSTLAGSGNEAFLDGPALAAEFAHPRGLAFDGQGRLLVADQGNHRVRMVTGGQVSTVAGSGPVGPPQFGGGGFADGPIAEAMFMSPRGIAVGPNGWIYVADTDNNRVRVVLP